MDQSPVMLRLISSSIGIASKAGAEVGRIIKSGILGVVDKGVQDYQTEADRVAQRLIVANLAKRFPKCTIVGEEDLDEDQEADAKLLVDTYDQDVLKMSLPDQFRGVREEDVTIWVDPLDGTAEFVKGQLDHVTVLIGFSVDGRAVAGVVHQPFHGYTSMQAQSSSKIDPSELKGRTMWAIVGLGCYGVERKSPPVDKFIVTTTASHGNANIEDSLTGLKADEVMKVGGAGHKVLLVIEGRAHSYVFTSFGCKRWDTCAPEAILEAAGGRLTTTFGDNIEYNHRADGDYHNRLGIIASYNQEIHSKVLSAIPEPVKDRLKGGARKSKEEGSSGGSGAARL